MPKTLRFFSMAKRAKRAEKAIESLKEEIEKHFKKIDKDIFEDDEIIARYHTKELDKSLIANLEKKMRILSKGAKETQKNKELLDKLKKKLEEYKKKI